MDRMFLREYFKDTVSELKRDFQIITKYIKYWFVILVAAGFTIFYNFQYFKLEKEIVNLNKEKSYLLAENMQLKKQKAVLSSPERIYKVATKKLKMKKVNLKQVHFIKTSDE